MRTPWRFFPNKSSRAPKTPTNKHTCLSRAAKLITISSTDKKPKSITTSTHVVEKKYIPNAHNISKPISHAFKLTQRKNLTNKPLLSSYNNYFKQIKLIQIITPCRPILYQDKFNKKFLLLLTLFLIYACQTPIQAEETKLNNEEEKLIEAFLLMADEENEKAIKLFEEILKNNPQNIPAYEGIAEAYIKTGDCKMALKWTRDDNTEFKFRDPYEKIYTDRCTKPSYWTPSHSQQSVSNCVVKNKHVGSEIITGNHLHRKLKEMEIGLVQEMDRKLNQNTADIYRSLAYMSDFTDLDSIHSIHLSSLKI